jgi:murein DD-endopeptidase / murein LD-carboxypeptidase
MPHSNREPENLEFSLSPLTIPARFHHVGYNGAHYPGAQGVVGLDGGANCQQFAFELIRHFGFAPPDYRSSELWEDETHTQAVVGELAPCDLLLFNRTSVAWGAHLAVYLGRKLAIHLSQRAGVPVIWMIEDFSSRPEYACFIGAKRARRAGETVG